MTRRSGDYLLALATGLSAGLDLLPREFKDRHLQYVRSAQRSDGGFAGRQGGSNLYYTSFALRTAELLRHEDQTLWRAAADFALNAEKPANVVECFCFLQIMDLAGERIGDKLNAQHEKEIAAAQESIRKSKVVGSGFGTAEGQPSRLYQTFIALLCGNSFAAEDCARFILSRRCEDGGFADSEGASTHAQGGTNPTAAAITALRLLRSLDIQTVARAADFFLSMQRSEGGFAANAEAPEADLLGTFTALVALGQLGALPRAKLAPAAKFVSQLEAKEGGFRAAPSDGATDLEFTHYALGTLGLLAQAAGKKPQA